MSDQEHGAGHHAITREAVRQFFASGRADGDGRIDGMTEVEYFHALDKAQENQDISVGPLPSYGTSVPAAWDGDAQRQHGMADPDHDGAWNANTDRRYVEGEMAAAHASAGSGDEMAHLGNATHALEDSYSEAHMFRGEAANAGDPDAPIESINVWRPQPHLDSQGDFHMKGWGDQQGTHDERFDEVPVQGRPDLDQDFKDPVPLVHGSDRAAAAATAEMLENYHDHRGDSADAAAQASQDTVGKFYQTPEGGPAVNMDEGDPAWQAERDRRLAEHQDEERAAGYDDSGTGGAEGSGPGTDAGASDESGAGGAGAGPAAEAAPADAGTGVPDPASEPNASYQPDEPNASYDPAQSSSQ